MSTEVTEVVTTTALGGGLAQLYGSFLGHNWLWLQLPGPAGESLPTADKGVDSQGQGTVQAGSSSVELSSALSSGGTAVPQDLGGPC
jgi:hypothetical protein